MKYRLCTIEKEHIQAIRRLRNQQIEVLRQFKPISSTEQEEYFSALHKDNKQILFSILENGAFIGYCGLTNINYVYGTAEISFISCVEKHEEIFVFALRQLCDQAFNVLNLNKVFTETYDFRKQHIKIIEDFGMIKDGVLREHVFKKGKRYDSVIHSLLRGEYEKIH